MRNTNRAAFVFSGDDMSDKTLSELAEEYYAEAQRLKKIIRELKKKTDASNPAAEHHTISVYESMLCDCMSAYNQLKDYYKHGN